MCTCANYRTAGSQFYKQCVNGKIIKPDATGPPSIEMILVSPDGIQAPYSTATLADWSARILLRVCRGYVASVGHVVFGDACAAVSLAALVSITKQHTS